MNITIKSELDGIKLATDYRNMNAKLIVEAVNNLIIDGHKIASITDIDGENN
jgi:hypothetical protein